jgi:hypothetical protein
MAGNRLRSVAFHAVALVLDLYFLNRSTTEINPHITGFGGM